MLGIGGFEFALVVLLALILFGPDKLPELARKAGRAYADFKRYTNTMEAVIRVEMKEGEKEAGDAAKDAAEAKVVPTAAPEAFEDDDDEEEEG